MLAGVRPPPRGWPRSGWPVDPSLIQPKGPFAPARSYVEIMLAGARDLEMDPEYIKKIEGFLSQSK